MEESSNEEFLLKIMTIVINTKIISAIQYHVVDILLTLLKETIDTFVLTNTAKSEGTATTGGAPLRAKAATLKTIRHPTMPHGAPVICTCYFNSTYSNLDQISIVAGRTRSAQDEHIEQYTPYRTEYAT